MATDTNDEVVDAETGPTETTDEVVAAQSRPTETTDEVVTTEPGPTETTGEVVTTEPRPTDTNDEVVETKTRPTSDEISETDARPTDTSAEAEQTERRPDLVWDAEARGLCVRVYGDGSKLFIFMYRTDDRQRFLRIGKTPIWSLEAARERAKELRAVVDQGRDPASYNRERGSVGPVENIIRYIAEHLRSQP
jgi:Arm DNA-binding domain